MATYTPVIAGTNGRPVKIAGTVAGSATTLYTVTGTAGEMDEVFLKLVNTDSNERKVTILLGGATNPDDYVEVYLSAESGPVEVLDGHRLNGGVVIKAFADAANVCTAIIDVNRIAT